MKSNAEDMTPHTKAKDKCIRLSTVTLSRTIAHDLLDDNKSENQLENILCENTRMRCLAAFALLYYMPPEPKFTILCSLVECLSRRRLSRRGPDRMAVRALLGMCLQTFNLLKLQQSWQHLIPAAELIDVWRDLIDNAIDYAEVRAGLNRLMIGILEKPEINGANTNALLVAMRCSSGGATAVINFALRPPWDDLTRLPIVLLSCDPHAFAKPITDLLPPVNDGEQIWESGGWDKLVCKLTEEAMSSKVLGDRDLSRICETLVCRLCCLLKDEVREATIGFLPYTYF